MGALVTKALRPIKSFNIENRAHRVISKEKPTPAPRYPQNIEDLKRTLEADPHIDEKLDSKDVELDKRLKDVFVTSEGIPEDDITKKFRNPNRPLPLERRQPEEYEFGFKEPEKVQYGKMTLRSAMEFIAAHQINPTEVTAEKIALEYKLKQEDVENVLKYFKTFEIYVPETKKAPATFAGPAALRRHLEQLDLRQLNATNIPVTTAITNKDKYSRVSKVRDTIKNINLNDIKAEVKNKG